MKSVITGPGSYTSKAGKCEVKYVDAEWAFGYDCRGFPTHWEPVSGCAPEARNHDILSPWTDKPKPIEAWSLRLSDGYQGRLYRTRDEAEKVRQELPGARLVHLIEAEDRG